LSSRRLDPGLSTENSPHYRLYKKTDFPQLRELLKTLKPEIAGIRSERLYDALCLDALSNRNIVIIIAEEDSRLIGFNVTIIGRHRFFRYFLFKHPLISLKIARQRLLKLSRGLTGLKSIESAACREATPYISNRDSGRSWQDSSPGIAKILFTAVRGGHRGRRISVGIGEFLLHILEDRGVSRLDTLVDPQNLPSIRLTYRLGFQIERRGEWLLGSIDIGEYSHSHSENSELTSDRKDWII